MLIKRIITILTLLSIVALHAELLIFKKTIEGFIESLTYEESLRFGPIISQIILKYQWPMCIMSDLTKEEKNELLTSGISRAEEIFIQKKLQEAIPGLDIQVAFIPTTLYEVLCLKQIIYISENDIKLKEIDFSKNVFERLAIGVIASRSHIDKYINFPRLYPKNGYLEYQFFNKMFFETMIKLCINERIPLKSNVQTMLDLVVAEDISSYMFVNNYIIQYLLVFMQKKMLGLNRVNVSNFVQTHIDEILEQLNTELKKCSLESSCLKNINSIWPHNYYFINEALLKKFITVEYLARDLNKALLFRGSSVLFGKSLQQKLIKTVQDESIKDIIGTTIQSNFERPFSISFGQSVFAGALFEGKERSAADPGACVYTFAQRMTTYALFIDKKEYMQSANNGLFFIAPLSTLAALFGQGEFFHARTKIALSDKQYELMKKGKDLNIIGFGKWGPLLFNSILMRIRNPWLHAQLFSEFIGNNGFMVNDTKEQEQNILASQKRFADVYAKVQDVEYFWNKWKLLHHDKKEVQAKERD